MKRAIYLDERERDLARRICDWVCLKAELELHGRAKEHVANPALHWFHDEVQALHTRFEEPETSPVTEEPTS